LPDLEGVARAFKGSLGSLIAVRTSALAPRRLIFLGAPLLGLLSKVIEGIRVYRWIKEVTVVRGVPVLVQI
jgi:hypothetical protein